VQLHATAKECLRLRKETYLRLKSMMLRPHIHIIYMCARTHAHRRITSIHVLHIFAHIYAQTYMHAKHKRGIHFRAERA